MASVVNSEAPGQTDPDQTQVVRSCIDQLLEYFFKYQAVEEDEYSHLLHVPAVYRILPRRNAVHLTF